MKLKSKQCISKNFSKNTSFYVFFISVGNILRTPIFIFCFCFKTCFEHFTLSSFIIFEEVRRLRRMSINEYRDNYCIIHIHINLALQSSKYKYFHEEYIHCDHINCYKKVVVFQRQNCIILTSMDL